MFYIKNMSCLMFYVMLSVLVDKTNSLYLCNVIRRTERNNKNER